jgi:hypothetical protein
MRRHSDALLDVLSGSFDRSIVVNVFHGADRVKSDLRFESWSLSGDLDNEIACTGSGTIVYDSVHGESLVPEGTKGVLSPFRATLELVMTINAGRFSESVSLGMFDLTKIRSAYDVTAEVAGVERVVASRVQVEFQSLDAKLRRWGFRSPEMPVQLESCFDEIRRISGMPVNETVADAAIPTQTVWEAKQGGRLDAVQRLARVLGGVALVDSAGALTIIPDEVGEKVGDLYLGARGTVVDVGYEVDTESVYNVVVGHFEDDDRNEIWAVAETTVGDLAVDGPYGENTRYYSSDFVKTQAQASTAVASILALSTGSQQYDVPIQCHINPLVELGDVLELNEWVRSLTGRLVAFQMSESELMSITLRVTRPL